MVSVRIGVVGGSFDPPHIGHVQVARAVRDARDLDRVLLVPAAAPPHKLDRELAPAADRLRMVELATAGEPSLEACGIELERPGPSYTIDTLRALRERLPAAAHLFFAIGADTLPELPSWREAAELLRAFDVVVVSRPGFDLALGLAAVAPVAGADRVERLRELAVEIEPCPFSSTGVRACLSHGEPVEGMLPEPVARYIAERGLYR